MDRAMEFGLFPIVLKPHFSQFLVVLPFPRFQLFSQLDNAGSQLPHLLVCCSHCRLDVLAVLETSLLQFFTQAEDCFPEKFDFKIGVHDSKKNAG